MEIVIWPLQRSLHNMGHDRKKYTRNRSPNQIPFRLWLSLLLPQSIMFQKSELSNCTRIIISAISQATRNRLWWFDKNSRLTNSYRFDPSARFRISSGEYNCRARVFSYACVNLIAIRYSEPCMSDTKLRRRHSILATPRKIEEKKE